MRFEERVKRYEHEVLNGTVEHGDFIKLLYDMGRAIDELDDHNMDLRRQMKPIL